MNYESGFTAPQAQIDVFDEEAERQRRRRRNIILILLAAGVAALIAWLVWGGGQATKQGGAGTKQVPSVTVEVPGRRSVERLVSATGNLAARRELPVGVPGEGGQIARVLVEPGDWVREGQVLATIDRSVQAQQAASLNAQITAAEADARLAAANLSRAQALVARGFISKAQIDQLTATRDAAVARANVARAQYRQSLASNARLDIRAPAAGLVLERRVEPGQVVSAGSGVLFRMARGGEMELLARLGEADLARLNVGQQATVTPVGSTASFKGQIWQVSPVIDPQSRQGVARIALSYDKALRPGGFASATIVSGVVDAPLLPESAVLNDTRGSYVYVVGRDNKVARRDVRVGEVTDAGVTVLEGLNGTETVVVSAGAFLNPGETIKPTRAKRPA